MTTEKNASLSPSVNRPLVVNPENSIFCQNFYETPGIWSVRGGEGSRRWRTGSVHLNILRLINSKTINIVTVRNISCGKVLCSHSSVILSMGSRYLVGGRVIPEGMYSGDRYTYPLVLTSTDGHKRTVSILLDCFLVFTNPCALPFPNCK